ncbi:MAG: GNAT family N-acetyltransferase [Streptosporangiaceae bacterium]
MSIRRAQASDAGAIAVVHVRSWQAAYRGLLPQDYLDGLDPGPRVARWEQRLAERDWPRGGVLVAEDAGQVVGLTNFCPSRDDDLDLRAVGEITMIYLLAAAWGRGHGRELMAGALAALRQAGYGEAALWVLDTNQRARRFYEAGGWRTDGAAKQEPWRDAGFTLSEVRYRHALPALTGRR